MPHAAPGARCCNGGGAWVPWQEESTICVSTNVLRSEAVCERGRAAGGSHRAPKADVRCPGRLCAFCAPSSMGSQEHPWSSAGPWQHLPPQSRRFPPRQPASPPPAPFPSLFSCFPSLPRPLSSASRSRAEGSGRAEVLIANCPLLGSRRLSVPSRCNRSQAWQSRCSPRCCWLCWGRAGWLLALARDNEPVLNIYPGPTMQPFLLGDYNVRAGSLSAMLCV